jgi:hypothetical protein
MKYLIAKAGARYRHMLHTANAIACGHYTSPNIRPLIPLAGLDEDETRDHQEQYEQRWAGWDEFSPEYRIHRVRSLIFEKLCDEFLVDPLFGLEVRRKNCPVEFERAMEKNEMIELLCPAITL